MYTRFPARGIMNARIMTRGVIILKDKKYISAGKAARAFGYTSDYIGQLCRAGKLECVMLGRGWFVTEDSLSPHKNENGNGIRGSSKYIFPSPAPQVSETPEIPRGQPQQREEMLPAEVEVQEEVLPTPAPISSSDPEEIVSRFIPATTFTPEDQWKIALTARFYLFP